MTTKQRRRQVRRQKLALGAASAVLVAGSVFITAMAAPAPEYKEVFIESFPEATPAEITIVIETEAPALETEANKVSLKEANPVNLSSSEEQMLLKVATAEAEDQGTRGMALVMRVVLNRVNSKSWPNNIRDVIYQKGQFEVISNGRYNRVTPNAGAYEALAMIESGWDESQGAEYFCMAGSSRWHERNLTRLFQYKDHVFYK